MKRFALVFVLWFGWPWPAEAGCSCQCVNGQNVPLCSSPFDLKPLSMAAKVAFENGARELVLLAAEGTSSVTAAALAAAYPKILNLHEVGVVVPVTAGITSGGDLGTAATDLANHCANASADGFFRIGIIGVDTGYTTGTPEAIAETANSKRVMVAWPNKLLYYNAFTGSTVEVGGQYLAAAYAGRLVSRPVQHGLTRKGITSFAGISATALASMTKAAKDTWSDSGEPITWAESIESWMSRII
jgi:hypothetical protein